MPIHVGPRCLPVLAVCSVFLLLTAPFPAPADSPGQGSFAAAEIGYRPSGRISRPLNRCLESRVYLQEAGSEVALSPALEPIADGDNSTHVELDLTASPSVEIIFIGAPRWLNRVDIDGFTATPAAGPMSIQVELLDLDRRWIPYGTAAPDQSGATRLVIRGSDAKVRGLRLVLSGMHRAASSARIHEVSAFFDQIDPDDLRAGGIAAGDDWDYHADWCNDYDSNNWNDLSHCDNDAEGLADNLPAGWIVRAIHGDPNGIETHFKRTDIGDGDNNNHIDASDLAYYSGHGQKHVYDTHYFLFLTALRWGTNNDDRHTQPRDGREAWGEADLEWVCLSCCEVLKDSSDNYWANNFNGAHLICGATVVLSDVNYGGNFANGMVSTSVSDPAKTVKSAWFDAVEELDGGEAGVSVLGDNSTMGNDYLWGEGTVAADPVPDGWFTYWRSTDESDLRPTGGVTAPPGASSSGAIGPHSTGAGERLQLPPKTPRGFPIRIAPRLLSPALLTTMPIYDVISSPVDSFYVRQVANTICPTFDVFCGGDIGPGDPGEINLIDGAHELRVSSATGAVHYENTATWLANQASAPDLLTGSQAVARANQILSALNRDHPDGGVVRVEFIRQGCQGKPPVLGEDPDSSFNIATKVTYRRRLGPEPGYRVVGPGGVTTVALGENGAVQRIKEGGWRNVTEGASTTILPVQQAVDALNTYGWDAAVYALRTPIESLEITGWELGYYEPDLHTEAQHLYPVYVFQVNITEPDSGVVQTEIPVWADRLEPRAQILTPADSTHVPQGSPVCFQGTGAGGVPPYTFRWFDDLGNLIGVNPSFCRVLAAPPDTGDGSQDRGRTVHLIVRDTLGREGNANVRIYLDAPTSVEGVGAPEVLSVSLIGANPFAGSTIFRVGIPPDAQSSTADLRMYDVTGRMVRQLFRRPLSPGRHDIAWDGRDDGGRDLPAGIYFYEFSVGERSVAGHAVMIR